MAHNVNMKPRKLSVFESRRFSAETFNLQHVKDSSKGPKEETPRLIENGKDVTPLPLVCRDWPSIEDVDFLDEGEYDSDSSEMENVRMPWVPKLMKEIVDDGKNSAVTSISVFVGDI